MALQWRPRKCQDHAPGETALRSAKAPVGAPDSVHGASEPGLGASEPVDIPEAVEPAPGALELVEPRSWGKILLLDHVT